MLVGLTATPVGCVPTAIVATTVFVAFGSDSAVQAPTWASFCQVGGSNLECSFSLAKGVTQDLPLGGQYLNATISFGAPVTCGQTKAEVNVNNPRWFDILDVSLVDGYSNEIAIDARDLVGDAGSVVLGPPNGPTGNERAYGVFPLGCDICTGRQHPPCGFDSGGPGCKSGTQYNPDVICQWQGSTKGGGTAVVVRLLAGIPMVP